jgi:drug/metabolite transporter (DMT)-like permease
MQALILGLMAGLCWSVHDLMARNFASKIGAYRLAISVLLVGAILLSALLFRHGKILEIKMDTTVSILVLGVVYGLAISSLFKAFSLAPVSVVGPFTAGYPALVVVWGMINGLHPSALQIIAILLILTGAVVVGRKGHEDGGLAMVAPGKLPALFFFCSVTCICFAAAIVLGQMASSKLGEIETTFLNRIPAALVLMPLLWREVPEVQKIEIRDWSAIALMALLDVIAVWGVNTMGKLPNKEFGAMGISAYGAMSVLLAMIFLKEKVAKWQWFGIAMIVLGVAFLT